MDVCQNDVWNKAAGLLMPSLGVTEAIVEGGWRISPCRTAERRQPHSASETPDTAGQTYPEHATKITFSALLRCLVQGCRRVDDQSTSALPLSSQLYNQDQAQSSDHMLHLISQNTSEHISLATSQALVCRLHLWAPPSQNDLPSAGVGTASHSLVCEQPVEHPVSWAWLTISAGDMLKTALKEVKFGGLSTCQLELCWRAAHDGHTAVGQAHSSAGSQSISEMSIRVGPMLPDVQTHGMERGLRSAQGSTIQASGRHSAADKLDMTDDLDCSAWSLADVDAPTSLPAHVALDGGTGSPLSAMARTQSPDSQEERPPSTSGGSSTHQPQPLISTDPLVNTSGRSRLSSTAGSRKRPKLTLQLSTDTRPRAPAKAPCNAASPDLSAVRYISHGASVASGISSVGSLRSQSEKEALLSIERTPSHGVSFELSPASVKLEDNSPARSRNDAGDVASEVGFGTSPPAAASQPVPMQQPEPKPQTFRLPLLPARQAVELDRKHGKVSIASRLHGRLTPQHLLKRPSTAPIQPLQILPIKPVTVQHALKKREQSFPLTQHLSSESPRVRSAGLVASGRRRGRLGPPRSQASSQRSVSVAMVQATAPAHIHPRNRRAFAQAAQSARPALLVAPQPPESKHLGFSSPLSGRVHASRFKGSMGRSQQICGYEAYQTSARRRAVRFEEG